MTTLLDHGGRSIRLTPERLDHILLHPEMAELKAEIAESLRQPERVIQSLSDPEAWLYYRRYPTTRVGDKYLCVVVKMAATHAFVVTAYLTDRVKRGSQLWPERK
jgi:hypothetical protein